MLHKKIFVLSYLLSIHILVVSVMAIPQLKLIDSVPPSVLLAGKVQGLASQVIDDRMFIALGSNASGMVDLRLFEFVIDTQGNEMLIQRYQAPELVQVIVQDVDWQEINGTHYLAVGGRITSMGAEDLRLFKYDTDEYGNPILTEVYRVPNAIISNTITNVKWQKIGSECFLAVSKTDGTSEPIRLFKFTEDGYGNASLTQVFVVPHSVASGDARAMDWQQIGTEFYLAVIGTDFTDEYGNNNENLRLFKYASDEYGNPQLIQVFKYDAPSTTARAVEWQTINGEFFLAVGANFSGGNVHIFKFETDGYNNELLTLKNSFSAGGTIFGDVAWKKIGSYELLAQISSVGAIVMRVSNVNVDDNCDVSTSTIQSINPLIVTGNMESLEWFEFGGKTYLAAAGGNSSPLDDNLLLFGLVNSVDSGSNVGFKATAVATLGSELTIT